MKTTKRLSVISAAIAVGLLAASGASQAESTYGYDPAGGTAARTATAKLNITVAVPKLILLRVGGSGTAVDTVNLGVTFNGIPGGVAANAMTFGDSQPSGWDGTAPALTVGTASSVPAWAWTNALGGGQLTAAVTTPFPVGSGLTATDIAVVSTPGLTHPGGTTGTTGGSTNFVRNAVATSNWTFSIPPAVLANITSGSYTQVMTYTATTL